MAAYEVLLLNTAVPQIQAAQAGDTYVVPRDIAVTADLSVTGNTILGDASTDSVRVNGYVGVGGAGTAGNGVLVTSSALTGTSQNGVNSSLIASILSRSAENSFPHMSFSENVLPTLPARSFPKLPAGRRLFHALSQDAVTRPSNS